MKAASAELYANLMALCESGDTFFYADHTLDGLCYRIFNYRLSSYSEFLKPDALWCRGTMFRMDHDPVLVCRPMQKFFNLNENPSTMSLDLSEDNIDTVEYKEDGSIISTFIHHGELHVKSKGSLSSEQALAAQAYLDANPQYKNELLQLTKAGITIDLEYCAPDNRIVLIYTHPCLTVLHGIVVQTGHHINLHCDNKKLHKEYDMEPKYPNILANLVKKPEAPEGYGALIASAPELTGIEGFIVYLKNGPTFKIKTEWYLTQHRCIDTINSDARLYEAILANATDDIKSLFATNEAVISRIEALEKVVFEKFNSIAAEMQNYYDTNKHLDRKSYAIKCTQEHPHIMSGAMNLYIGRSKDAESEAKQWMDKHVDEVLESMK